MVEREFSQELLDATGVEIKVIPPAEARFAQGLWVAVHRDRETSLLTAISPSYTNGQAAAIT